MTQTIENKLRQALPILIKVPESGELSLYILKDREVKEISDDAISQDLTDKDSANLLSITPVVEELPEV